MFMYSESYRKFLYFFQTFESCQILAKYSLLTSVSSSILDGIFFYDPTFLLSRLLISFRTASDIISENWKDCSTLILSFIYKTLFIDILIGSSISPISVKRSLFSVISIEFTAVLLQTSKVFATFVSSVNMLLSLIKKFL